MSNFINFRSYFIYDNMTQLDKFWQLKNKWQIINVKGHNDSRAMDMQMSCSMSGYSYDSWQEITIYLPIFCQFLFCHFIVNTELKVYSFTLFMFSNHAAEIILNKFMAILYLRSLKQFCSFSKYTPAV